MRRVLLKTFTVLVLSFSLLYYGVAWAALNCSYLDADNEKAPYQLPTSHVYTDLECAGPQYHTESMAEASSTSRLHWLARDISAGVNDFLTLREVTENRASDVGLRAVFESVPSLSFVIALPRYLSLSTLRI